jgi:hypothetical protein
VVAMASRSSKAESRSFCCLIDLYGESMLIVRGPAIAGYVLLT